jgi:hypothetical protein
MDKRIFDIGCAKYKIDTEALRVMIEESRESACASGDAQEADNGADRISPSSEQAFLEVMELCKEYSRTQSLDVLVKLRSKLEEVSMKYRSMAMAEEVLTINSCLPYERRIQRETAGIAFLRRNEEE